MGCQCQQRRDREGGCSVFEFFLVLGLPKVFWVVVLLNVSLLVSPYDIIFPKTKRRNVWRQNYYSFLRAPQTWKNKTSFCMRCEHMLYFGSSKTGRIDQYIYIL